MRVSDLMKLMPVCVQVLCLLCLLGCSESLESEEDDADDGGSVDVKLASAKLITQNTSFGLRLFREIAEHDTGVNIFISPISIEIALAMTYNGAAGETQRAMSEALGLEGLSLAEVK